MPAQNEPAAGMDFWAAIGVGQETEDEPDENAAQNGQTAAAPAETTATGAQTTVQQEEGQSDWAALFSAWDDSANGAPPEPPQSAPAAAPKERTDAGAASPRASETVTFKKPKAPNEPPDRGQDRAWATPQDEPEGGPHSTGPAPAPDSPQVPEVPETAEAPETSETSESTEPPPAAAAPRAAQALAADQDWVAAERIANSLRPRLPQMWLEVLTRHTDGDAAMASKVYNVLNGSHLLGELMRDRTIDEVHVHGTQVTVCGPHGIRQVPGFPTLAASRRAIKVIAASREKTGMVVSKLNDYVVISRRNGTGPNAGGLIAGGVVTEEQAGRIREALERMQAVTVTGPAARIVVRALASLIPEGSRVFLGAYATVPAGCVSAASPMEADYVLGVRPGAVAEQMAAAGQVGALIANPETRFEATLQFTVTGQSAAPDKLLAR